MFKHEETAACIQCRIDYSYRAYTRCIIQQDGSCARCKQRNQLCVFTVPKPTKTRRHVSFIKNAGQIYTEKRRISDYVSSTRSIQRNAIDRNEGVNRVRTHSNLMTSSSTYHCRRFEKLVEEWLQLPAERLKDILPGLTHYWTQESQRHVLLPVRHELESYIPDEIVRKYGNKKETQLDNEERIHVELVLNGMKTDNLENESEATIAAHDFASSRFRLPSSDLLDAIHWNMSELAALSQFKVSEATGSNRLPMFGRLTPQALVCFGIMAQELLRDEFHSARGTLSFLCSIHSSLNAFFCN